MIHVRAEYGPLSTSEVTSTNAWDDRANPCCRPGSWGAEFVADVCPVVGEAIVVKHRYSAFVDTPLDLMLRAGKIRTVVVAGVATHCCVESTARDANMRDYHVVIPEDAVAVRGGMEHLHRASLETLGMYFGTISTTRAIGRVWETCSPVCSA